MELQGHRGHLAVFTVLGGLILAASLALANVSVGQASRVWPDSKKTCNATGPCLWYVNNGSGDGVEGGSAGNGAGLYGTNSDSSTTGTGAGVAGVSKVQTGVYGSSADLDGVFGTAAGNGAGVYGANSDSSTSGNGAGVAGVSKVQNGVYGSSVDLDGVFGTAAGNGAGVYGANSDSSTSGNGAGVAGISQAQTGVYGSSGSNVGVYGKSQSAAAVVGVGQSGAGIEGVSTGFAGGIFTTPSTFAAISGTGDNSGGLSAYNKNHTFSAIYGEADDPAGSPLFVSNRSTQLGFFVDSNGNGNFSGKVFATAFVTQTRMRDGRFVQSYAAKSTENTIEDTGSGSIVLGSGTVRFDPNFARTIDASRGYQVLITPDGDNRGLFVSYKSPIGFGVREAQGGRSTIMFDYRVVAHPIGGDTARLATVTVERPPFAPPRISAAMFKNPPLLPPLVRAAMSKHPPLAPHPLRPRL